MYNIGIVSTSNIGEQFIEGVKKNENVKVKAVYSRNKDTGKVFAKKNSIENVYTDYNELLKDDNIDIIYISSPNSLHFKQAMQAINNNKHVIVEKPITLSKKDLERLYKEAELKKVLVMEAIVNIHYNSFKKIKEWIGEIGAIHYASFNFHQQTRHFENYKKGLKINVFSSELGGGALRDLGPYPIYPLIYFFGMPKNIKYSSLKNSESIDETTTLLCIYKNMNVSISVSKLFNDYRENVILGTNGRIEISHINYFNNIKLYDNEGVLIKELTEDHSCRMKEEVDYFVNKLLNNEKIDQEFISSSLEVCEIIEKNYE